ncbi:MAG: sulfatase [Thermoanaerobaculales bacterium]|nr:sulfatase [Thermoanaerobaculales bacterium]
MTRLRALASASLGLLAACAAQPEREVDLAALAAHGERRQETRAVALDGEGERRLLAGWSRPERLPDGRPFRWALGESSSFGFYCAAPRELELVLSLRPFARGGAEQGLRCRVNGRELGRRSFRGWSELRFAVPAEAVVVGDNLVELLWDHAARPSEVGASSDTRPLAAAVRAVAVGGLLDAEPAAASAAGLLIPAASELRLAAHVGADARLALRAPVGGASHLEVWSRQDGEPWQRRCGPCGGRPLALGNPEGPLELALRAGPGGAVRIEEAFLRWREAPPVPVELPSFARPDVVLYVVDTLRADRLGCSGGPEGISPAIDGLAAEGALFERAVAQSSWTKPSMVSLLSGLLTTEHGVRAREPVIPAAVPSLAERFAAAGYRTGAFTANAYLTRGAGFDRGFEHFEFAHLDAHALTRRAIAWLRGGDDGRPVFLWVHTIDPHAPYEPREPFRGRWAPGVPAGVGSFAHVRSLGGRPAAETAPFIPQYRALYDAEVAQNDAAFGELLDALRAAGRFDDACVVLASDHGEGFWEHGVNGHGWDLFEEAIHVPLVVKPPRWRRGGERVGRLVQHVDLAPTLLRITGLPPLGGAEARDLFDPDPRRVVFSEMLYDGRAGFAVRAGELKLVEPLSPGFLPRRALFDLAADPAETSDLAAARPVTAAWLAFEGRRRMALLEQAPQPETAAALSTEERRALEALGYLAPGG